MTTQPFWMNFLQQNSQSNEGLWPTEKPLYDPGNFCQLQGPSKDSCDAQGNPVVVRTSSSLGMWETQEECCQDLWCQERCDAFAQSPCNKATAYTCESRCAKSPTSPPSPSGGHHGHHKKHHCLTQKGVQYCGEDCKQAGEDGFGCWDEKTCEQVSPDKAVHGKRYFPDMARCCVEYTALNGASDVTTRCAADPTFQRRVTDYRKQEPAGSGGYEDRGEFPPATPLAAPSPRPQALHKASAERRSHNRHSRNRPSHDQQHAPYTKTLQLKSSRDVQSPHEASGRRGPSGHLA